LRLKTSICVTRHDSVKHFFLIEFGGARIAPLLPGLMIGI
jgi:hypothetical protein